MDNPVNDEASLLICLKQGDQEAFAILYQQYAADLLRYAASRMFRLEDARDIIQDVFIKLWNDRAAIQVNTGIRQYLYGMVRNRVIDHIRKNAVREEYALLLQYLGAPDLPDPLAQLEAKEFAASIQQTLAKLSPKVREVYHLSREQQLSIPEIAAQLQVSEQTVKNQLTTALNHLRKSLVVPSAFLISGAFWWLS